MSETLAAHLASGAVWIDGGEYVGCASDGAEVSLGWDLESTERYLADRPSPSSW